MITDLNLKIPSPKELLAAQEISFARVLAGNDKILRDRALKRLKKWLSAKSESEGTEFSEDDFLRIWKGLYYCMWMSDKFLIQEQVAEHLSSLVHCFTSSSENGFLFIKCFFKTMCSEWTSIDQLRIDKFAMLIRRFLRQSLFYCSSKGWEKHDVKCLMRIFDETILHPSTTVGLTIHLMDIYLEEVSKVGKGSLDPDIVTLLIEPFVKLLITNSDGRIRSQLRLFIKQLIDQTDVGLRYKEKYEAWKQAGFPGGDVNTMKLVKKHKKRKNVAVYDDDDDEILETDELYEANDVLDPRAGHVDVLLHQISIDENSIINMIQSCCNSNNMTAKKKKIACILIKQFKLVKAGKYPYTDKKIELHANVKLPKIKSAAKNLIRFERNLIRDKKRKKNSKNKKKMNTYIESNGELDDISVEMNENDQRTENGTITEFSDEDGNTENEKIDEEQVEKQKRELKRKKYNNKQKENKHSNSKFKKKPDNKLNFKKGTSTGKKNDSLSRMDFTIEDVESSSGITANKSKKLSDDWIVDKMDVNSPEYKRIVVPRTIKIERIMNKSPMFEKEEEHNPVAENSTKNIQTNGVDPWQQPLQDGEVEIFIPLKKKKIVFQESKANTVPVFWQNARAKAAGRRKSMPVTQEVSVEHVKSPSTRRISFAINLNRTQDNEEYLEEVKRSPSIPYDGNRKPTRGVLKRGLLPSPINPFCKLQKKRKLN